MSTERQLGNTSELPEEDAVIEYLHAHPDFFERHPELVTRLRVPHDSGEAVSLVEKQVSVLRQQNRQLERRLVDLVDVARNNDGLVDRMHQLALALVAAQDRHEVLAGIDSVLREHFGADEVVICLFDTDGEEGPARRVARDDPELAPFRNFLSGGRPQLGRLSDDQLRVLFGEDREGRVGSAALLPIGPGARDGMIAVGSRHKDRFSPNQGTVFLERMAELVATALSGPHGKRR